MKLQKILSLAFVFALPILSVAGTTYAADLRIGAKNNGSVNIGAEEVITNLYTGGNIVTIDANVEKGLHAAGNVVNINGNVGQSVYSAGGTVMVNGDVLGSVHTAGGSVVVGSKISDDLFIAGGNVMVSKQASVGGDLMVGGGTIDIQGPVVGDVSIGGGVVTINSEIGGNVKINQVDELILGSSAVINGNLEYYSKKPIQVEEGAVVKGETIVNEKKAVSKNIDKGVFAGVLFTIISVALLIKMVGLLIVGLIFAYVFKKTTEACAKEGLTSFWKSLLTGLVLFLITPIASVILIVTLFGLWLGLVVLMIYFVSLTIAAAITGIIFGIWLAHLLFKKKDYTADWKIVIGGTVILAILGLIPVVGWFMMLVLVLVSLGAFYRSIFAMHK